MKADMNETGQTAQLGDHSVTQEAGQSIVLITAVFIGLLAFVGIAVDVGFAFVRSSQFSAAVDSAALAGVVDLDPTDPTSVTAPNRRAEQFLAANGWPTPTLTSLVGSRSLTDQGIPQYSLTVTWPVANFFLRLVGFDHFDITRSATAAFFSQAELYTTSAYERGHMRKTAQFISARNACTKEGDPVSPLNSSAPGVPNSEYARTDGTYRYRIRVPDTYTQTNIVRVELFDPDSMNLYGNNVTVNHSVAFGGGSSNLSCSTGPGERCVIPTGESAEAINQNPFWFSRVDENWDASCNADTGNAPAAGSAITVYWLYYFDNTGQRVSLARYTETNANPSDTDLRWVSPGVTANVPVDAGSPGTFEVDISPIPPNPDDSRFIYLDVLSNGGTAKNVWDLWAGFPPNTAYYSPTLPADVNQRNLQLADIPTLDGSGGVTVFALGRLPLQHFYTNKYKLPLAPVDTAQAGGTIYATLFDFDIAVPPPVITFTIDTLSISDFHVPASVVASNPSPSVPPWQATCDAGQNCDNSWYYPQLKIGVPTTIFLGGNLEANYRTSQDAHTWFVSVTAGQPVLTR